MKQMKSYRLLAVVAGNLKVDEKTLLEFSGAGWINIRSKGGAAFVSNQDEYLCRFILHLRQKLKLTDDEIGFVLENEAPPYSLDKVAAILARRSAGTEPRP